MRFSAVHQGKGSTIHRQQALVDQWLVAHPEVELSPLSFKDLGKSGFTGTHLKHGLWRLLEAIEAKKIKSGDYILVEAIDRIGRLDPLPMIELISKIVKSGVTIITLEDNTTYSKDVLNSATGSLVILVGKIQQAHEYSKNLSRRLSSAYERKRILARKGEAIKINSPMWLDKQGQVNENGEAVRACIELYLKGYGTRKILLNLIDTYPQLKGVYPSTLKRWFSHLALIGSWGNQGDPIKGVFEPLIDVATYYKLQRELAKRTKVMSPEQTYDLSGLVVCDQCEARYYYRRKLFKESVITYANCSTYLKRGKPYCDNNKTWPYEVLIEIFKRTYGEDLSTVTVSDRGNAEAGKIDALEGVLFDLNKQIDTLLELLLAMPDQQNLRDKLITLNDEKNSLLLQKSKISINLLDIDPMTLSDDEDLEIVDSLNDLYDEYDSDPIHRRELLKRVGYKIMGSGNTMSVEAGPAGIITYKLSRRSQKHLCYIVEDYYPEHSIENGAEDGEFIKFEASTGYLAISRDGLIAESDTESELIEQLKGCSQVA
jgi:DNA invertase Pin-like site-specific DNA recombinase